MLAPMHRRTAPGVILAVVLIASACGGPASPTPSGQPTPTSILTASPAATPTPTPPETQTPEPTRDARASWTRLETAGDVPAAREDHTWTVDGPEMTAYLFGGRAGSTTFDDLWAYDLATDAWREVEPAGPRPLGRFGHEAQWVVGRLVVFAGQADASTFFGDLWAYDPGANAWTELPAAGDAPVPRYGSCSAWGEADRLWISHGFTEDGARFFDTRAYDFIARRWTDMTPPGPAPVERCLHVCWWTADGRFALYGGQTTGVAALGDLWALTPGAGEGQTGSWAKIEVERPSERALPAAAIRAEAEVILFGGKGLDGAYLADLYRIDGLTLQPTPIAVDGVAPGGRAAATLIHDKAGRRLLLFGGKDAAGANAELWALTLR